MKPHDDLAVAIASTFIEKGIADPARFTQGELETLLHELFANLPATIESYANGHAEGMELAGYFKGLTDGLHGRVEA